MKRTNPVSITSLDLYLAEINRFPLLSAQEEQELAREYQRDGDTRSRRRSRRSSAPGSS